MNSVPRGLLEHFRQHNRHALGVAVFSFLGAILSWAAAYCLVQWVGLLFLTATKGLDTPATIGSRLQMAVGVILLLILGWVVRRWKTEDQALNWLTVLAGFVSIPARLTFAILDNLRARVFPGDGELVACWVFLTTLQHRKKIALHELRGIAPPNVASERIIYLLGIVELADTDSYSGIFYLHLRNEESSRLIRRWSHSLENAS